MKTKEKSITKICSFYANKWHLTTMILPYISKMIENGYEIETLLGDGIKENMEELIAKLNINNETKEKILNIEWKSKDFIDIEKININKTIILVGGDIVKIRKMNKYIEENVINDVSIINCYNVTQIEDNIVDILSTHDLILNTSGNHKINECLHP